MNNSSIYGNKDDLYDRLKRHAYPGKKGRSTQVQKFHKYSKCYQNKANSFMVLFADKSDSESEGH